ncbi:MAG: hypothetical protein DRP09_03495 [Candidatus Thorarchaeota archaeon]|nr:MAG: hypothetical protein DRP09_03495 [Candidatus Thorarchaeota archaeon]
MNIVSEEKWSVEQSRLVYGVGRKDLHFLDITEEGELCIRLRDQTITFREILERLEKKNGHTAGYTSSFTLRIPQLIAMQIKKIRSAFKKAMRNLDYTGEFRVVFPVKVNQRSDCVIPVVKSDRDYGMEAGTKTELLLIKSVLQDERQRQIVCNGAKDPEYLELILRCINEGYNMSVSVESLHEAKMIIDMFPVEKTNLVLRIKPYLSVEGHWSHSTGRDSKFGLSIHDLHDVLDLLNEKGFTSTVRTILAHAGSQIEDLDAFKRFGRFMTNLYVELRQRGLSELRTIDFGGGLAIDYQSSLPDDFVYQYARMLIEGVIAGLEDHKRRYPPPDIMIESGRGVTALASLVVVKALEVRSVFPPSDRECSNDTILREEAVFKERINGAKTLDDLVDISNEFHERFSQDLIGLDPILERERVTGRLERALRAKASSMGLRSFDSEKLERSFWHPEHVVIGNFSVFNSIADHVLVSQHFPVIPIHDLHLRPETTVRLVDITCDSDGEISQFYLQDSERPLFTRDNRPVTMPGGKMGHGIPVGILERVVDGCFVLALTGAYQDAIEMDHNLLGDLPDVELILQDDDQWHLRWVTGAESIRHLLEDVGYQNLGNDEDPYMNGAE